MRTIDLGPGIVTRVSDEDFEFLSQWAWHPGPYGYARRQRRVNGKVTRIALHQVVANRAGLIVLEGQILDHRDRDRLNNQRDNLRVATRGQNKANSRGIGRSRFLGVYAAAERTKAGTVKWVAQITVNGDQRYLGRFNDEADAARAYDRAAREHFGEFANPNFPDE